MGKIARVIYEVVVYIFKQLLLLIEIKADFTDSPDKSVCQVRKYPHVGLELIVINHTKSHNTYRPQVKQILQCLSDATIAQS